MELLQDLLRGVLANFLTPSFKRRTSLGFGILILSALVAPDRVAQLPTLVRENPHLAATMAFLVGILWHVEGLNRFAERIRYQWKISKWAGISRVFPVAPYPDLSQGHPSAEDPSKVWDAADRALKDLVKTMPNTRLRLLLVSGWRMIGCEAAQGLLYQELSTREALTLEVLLLNPEAKAAIARADALGLTHDQYRQGVDAVLWTLRHWTRTRPLKITAFLYDEDPIWQMAISKAEIWLLCAAQNIPTGRSPIYCLRRDAEYGLAVGIKAVWDRRRALARPVDLEAVHEPDWKRLKDLVNKTALPPARSA